MDERQGALYGLAELADAAGVSIRTVRYYISEGLLPPPEGAGPRSAYTAGHLDRLRLIGRLKDAYLPLREIRRRLGGLDDGAVRDLLTRLGPPAGGRGQTEKDKDEVPQGPLPDSAAAYLSRVMGPRPAGDPPLRRVSAPMAPSRPGPLSARLGASVGDQPAAREQVSEPVAALLGRAAPDWPDAAHDATRALDLDPALVLAPPVDAEAAIDGSWRRISLGSDAELLIREEAYQRRRDRIEWLVGWAKKVLKP